MFNNITYSSLVNIKPACSGMLQKSHPKAFFLRFHKTSEMAQWLFCPSPYIRDRNDKKIMDVIVLQVMSFGDNEFLCEIIDIKEFETAAI